MRRFAFALSFGSALLAPSALGAQETPVPSEDAMIEPPLSLTPLDEPAPSAANGSRDDADGAPRVILELVTVVDGEGVDRISLYASDVLPNTWSIDDRYVFARNGVAFDAPRALAEALDRGRSFAVHFHAGGIVQEPPPQMICMLGGPAVGDVLNARYITYAEDSSIESEEMRPVFSEAQNCLFVDHVYPQEPAARLEAAKALAMLQTIRAYADAAGDTAP